MIDDLFDDFDEDVDNNISDALLTLEETPYNDIKSFLGDNLKMIYSLDNKITNNSKSEQKIHLTEKYPFVVDYCHWKNLRYVFMSWGQEQFYLVRSEDLEYFKIGISIDDYVFDEDIKNEIDNFVENGLHKYKKYNIHLNNGLILYGKPGNGKTIYLKYLQKKYNVSKINSDAVFDKAYGKPFKEGKIQLFDDINLNRFNTKHPSYNSLISQMDDGSENSFIRVFTTNEDIDDISEAFKRPGRITKFIHIKPPKEYIRRKILSQIPINDLDHVVEITDGYTMAELQMLKIYVIESDFDNDKALELFYQRLPDKREHKIGF